MGTDVSAPDTETRGRPWTPEEIERLGPYGRSETPLSIEATAQLAGDFQRSTDAIRSKVIYLRRQHAQATRPADTAPCEAGSSAPAPTPFGHIQRECIDCHNQFTASRHLGRVWCDDCKGAR
jgi:hypothetical protein